MTIESLASDRNSKIADATAAVATVAPPVTSKSTVATTATSSNATSGIAAPVDESAINAAIGQLQTAISNGPNPDFKLDYLSGLSVVTVRSTITGQVMYQLPDTRALELARMIKDGVSVGSLGLFSTIA